MDSKSIVCRAGVHRDWEGKAMGHRPVFRIAVLTLVFVGGCAHKPDDATLVSSIESQMSSDQLLKGADLRVQSNRGEVTLSGTVASEAARQEAYKLATQTPGVLRVNDRMSVAQEAEATQLDVMAAPVRPAPLATRIQRERKKPESDIAEMKSVDGLPSLQTSAPQPVASVPQSAAQSQGAQPQLAPASAPAPAAAATQASISATAPAPVPAPQP